jgi:uncharacterized protein (TIGR03435 family)
MRTIVSAAILGSALMAGQEFEAASVKMNPPQTGFHFSTEAVSGGPGTADPAMFRCLHCSLGTLILKAYRLQPYQFPGRTSLNETTYDVTAKIPEGASAEAFSAMLQSLLKQRFGLIGHFEEKKMKGYRLVVAKGGAKLKESSGEAASAAPTGVDAHGGGRGEAHNHSGAMVFGNSAMYRASNAPMAELARVLSDQLSVPVEDGTELTGKYDIALRWSGGNGGAAVPHTEGGEYHGRDGGAGAAAGNDGPTLFDALQQQLGLKLVAAEQAKARLFVVEKVSQKPTEN